jgi:hypothetical protein
MIGIAKIPLKSLVKGASISSLYPINNSKNERCGNVEV